MTTVALAPTWAAAQATAAPWLPAVTATSPRSRSSSGRVRSRLRAPRALKEPVFWTASSLTRTWAPVRSSRVAEVRTGVRCTRPAIRAAADRTAAGFTSAPSVQPLGVTGTEPRIDRLGCRRFRWAREESMDMEMRLEVVPIPVSDVDAAKAFYTERVGFHLDHDVRPNEGMRVVQLTPPGSACSVVLGEGLPLGEPGSVKGVQLVVQDVDAVREALAGRGVPVGDVQQLGPEGTPGSRYVFFEDPDGNVWAVQEYKRG